MARTWLHLGLGASAVAALGVGVVSLGAPSAPKTRLVTATVQRGVVTSTISGTGDVIPVTDLALNFAANGQVTEIDVTPGEHVSAGQVLAKLDQTTARANLGSAQANLQAARAKLQQLVQVLSPQQRAQDQVALTQAQAQLDTASQTLADLQPIASQDATDAAATLSQARVQLQTDQAQLGADQTQLNSDQAQEQVDQNHQSADQSAVSADQAQLGVDQAKQQADQQAQANDQGQLGQDQASESTDQSQLQTDQQQLASDQQKQQKDCAANPNSADCTTNDPAAVNADQSRVNADQANVSADRRSVAADQSKLTQDAKALLADAYAIGQDQSKLSTDNANLATDKGDTTADKNATTSDQAKITADTTKLAADSAAVTNDANAQALGKLKDTQSLDAAQRALVSAQVGLQATQAANAVKEQPPLSGDLAAAEASVAQAEAQLTLDQYALSQTVLTAPAGGTVASVNGAVGQGATAAGTAASSSTSDPAAAGFIHLADVDALQVEVGFTESDAAKVKPGQPATIAIQALPDHALAAHVVSIDTLQTVVSNVVNYNVTLALDRSTPGIKPGMTANVTLVVGSADAALHVPSSAVRGNGANAIVDVLGSRGQPTPTPVVVGLRGDTAVQILSGLTQGQTVVVSSTRSGSLTPPGSGSGAARPGGFGGGGFGRLGG